MFPTGLHHLDKLYLELRRLTNEVNDVYRIYNTPGPCDVNACYRRLETASEQLRKVADALAKWTG